MKKKGKRKIALLYYSKADVKIETVDIH